MQQFKKDCKKWSSFVLHLDFMTRTSQSDSTSSPGSSPLKWRAVEEKDLGMRLEVIDCVVHSPSSRVQSPGLSIIMPTQMHGWTDWLTDWLTWMGHLIMLTCWNDLIVWLIVRKPRHCSNWWLYGSNRLPPIIRCRSSVSHWSRSGGWIQLQRQAAQICEGIVKLFW